MAVGGLFSQWPLPRRSSEKSKENSGHGMVDRCLSNSNVRQPEQNNNEKTLGALKDIGSQVNNLYVEYALTRIQLQESWWAKAMETFNLYADKAGSEYQLDPDGILSCHATTASVGVGNNDNVTSDHRDTPNASFEYNGIHDSHLNVTANRNMGMVVHLLDADDYLQPYIIVLDALTATLWSARTWYHSIVHIGTYLKCLYQKTTTESTSRNEMVGVKEF
jgi:hypothetical protein